MPPVLGLGAPCLKCLKHLWALGGIDQALFRFQNQPCSPLQGPEASLPLAPSRCPPLQPHTSLLNLQTH